MTEVSLDANFINSIEKEKELKDLIVNKVNELIANKKEELGEEISNRILNSILLSTIDRNWPAQITRMDYLKSGVFYRQYESKNPLTVYKNEGYKLFNKMFTDIAKQSLVSMLKVELRVEPVKVEEEKQSEDITEEN